jgi:hypothetical protein
LVASMAPDAHHRVPIQRSSSSKNARRQSRRLGQEAIEVGWVSFNSCACDSSFGVSVEGLTANSTVRNCERSHTEICLQCKVHSFHTFHFGMSARFSSQNSNSKSTMVCFKRWFVCCCRRKKVPSTHPHTPPPLHTNIFSELSVCVDLLGEAAPQTRCSRKSWSC